MFELSNQNSEKITIITDLKVLTDKFKIINMFMHDDNLFGSFNKLSNTINQNSTY